jgi:hypothetical protein
MFSLLACLSVVKISIAQQFNFAEMKAYGLCLGHLLYIKGILYIIHHIGSLLLYYQHNVLFFFLMHNLGISSKYRLSCWHFFKIIF